MVTERLGVTVERQASANDLLPGLGLGQAFQRHVQAKTVEQLRAQLALFRVHGADQHETGIVPVRDAVALDAVGATGSHIEQQVNQRVRQQVDLIDIQHATVGLGQHPRGKLRLALPQRGIQVEGADQPLFTGAQWQGHERAFAKQVSQATGQGALGHATRPFDQHAADLRVDGGQAQRQLQVVGTDHRRQRKLYGFTHFKPVPRRRAVVLRGLRGNCPAPATNRAAGPPAGAR